MAAEPTCPKCGSPLDPEALEGLCPKCVGRAAFDDPSTLPQPSTDLEEQFARLKPEEAGEKIGRYKLLQQIGEGGFGTVWMAEQTEPVRRRVALKIIKLGMDTKEVVARFEQERQALAMMDHPNIAKVFDAGATQWGRPFFVMELVRGIKITDYCDQANLPTADRLQLFIAVCHAVQHAHQKGIIHRDLKPSNVLVTLHDGVPVPKVIDFGVAKATQSVRLTDLTLFTQFEQMIGTPLYMSPEQAEMSGLDIDTRTDIYSLGVLLYELLTGRTPFDPEELMKKGNDEIRRTIREQEPQTPSMFLKTMAAERRATVAQHRQSDPAALTRMVRGDLDWIVMKALEKDRARRYETANGLAKDIERHLANEPVLARPAGRIYRFRRLVRRNRAVFAAGGVVTFALLAGLGISIAALREERAQRRVAESERRIAGEQRERARRQESIARRRSYVADMNLAFQALGARQFGRGRRFLDAHRPRNVRDTDLRGWEWRWLWQQLRGDAVATVSRRAQRVAAVSFSADGRRIAAGFADGRVEISDTAGATPSRPLQTDGPAACVAFSPAANAVVFGSRDGLVRWHDFTTDEERVLCRAPANVHDLSFSRDGAWLAVLTRASDSGGTTHGREAAGETVLVIEAAEGRLLHRIAAPQGGGEFFNNVRISADHERLYVTGGAFAEPRVRCVRLADEKTLWEATAQPEPGGRKVTGFSAMDLAPDGRMLATATGYDQRSFQLWDALSGARLQSIEAHDDYVTDLAFSPDGSTLATASSDESVRLWNVKTGAESAPPLCGNGDEVEAVAFSADGRRLATGSRDGLVLLWEPGTRPASGSRRLLPPATRFAFLLPGGRHAFTLEPGNRRSLIDVRTNRITPLPLDIEWQGFWGGPNFLAFPDRAHKVALYEIADAGAKPLGSLSLGHPMADWFAYSPEARLLAWTEPETATIHVTPLDRPNQQIDLISDREFCLPASFDHTGQFLLAKGPGGDARVWDIARRQRIPAAEDYFSPFGMTVFGDVRNALATPAIRDWVGIAARRPAASSRFTRTDPIPSGLWPDGHITSRAYSADGRTTAVATENGSVLLFDAETQEKIALLRGRAHSVFGLAFSPDGTRLLSADDSVWDVETGREMVALSAAGALHSISQFSEDAILVGSWHGPGEFQYWRAPAWEEIEEAERSGRGWRRSEE